MARSSSWRAMLIALLLLCVAACEETPKGTFTILAGSENKTLEPIVVDFCRERGWTCEVRYLGSVDIKLALQSPDLDVDAVWPAQSRWIELGDEARRVKHARSIMTSPVAFGIRESVADRLGLQGRPVTTAEIVDLVRDGRLTFLMTSATQSNSGFSAYIALLTALAGRPEVLTPDMLDDPALQAELATVLKGVERSAGSSGWLKDLYLEGARQGLYTAMVNYEAVLIETNQALEKEGLETLHLIYPADGTALADSPLGFVARGQPDAAEREAFLLALQEHLLSPPIQRRILAAGRRTGLGGGAADADPAVFRRDWGIDPQRMPAVIRFPSVATIERALALYQETLRKPSLLALCLDFSGSMQGEGSASLKAAIGRLFDPNTARRYLVQPTLRDVFIVLAFNSDIKAEQDAKGPDEAAMIPSWVERLQPEGGTDIYRCASVAIAKMVGRPEWSTHLPGVILMTDGKSQGDAEAFAAAFRDDHLDVPVHGITFGDADASQLEWMARLTRARVFDGRRNLEEAFRHARGYN